MVNQLFAALKKLNIKASKSYFKAIYEGHPEFPALLAITDSLSVVGVKHSFVKYNEELHADSYENNILAFIPAEGGKFEYLDKVADNSIADNWEGIALVIDKNQDKESDPIHKRYKENSILQSVASYIILSFVVALISITIFDISDPFSKIYYLLSVGGVTVSLAILYKEIGFKNKMLDSFCTGQTSDCDDVLKSQYSFAFKNIKWADLIFSYFFTQVLLITYIQFYGSSINNSIVLLGLISGASMTIVLASIYVQKIILGTWCRLCLMVSATIASQSLIFLFFFSINSTIEIDVSILIIFLLLFVFTFVLEVKIKRILIENVGNKLKLNSFKKVILPGKVFDSILSHQPSISGYLNESTFVLGNVNAPIRLTVASNLYCDHCRTHFFQLVSLLNKYGDKFSVEFRFILNSIDVGVYPNTNEYLFQYIYENSNQSKFQDLLLEVLTSWYSNMDMEIFKKSHIIKDVACLKSRSMVKNHFDWFSEYGIRKTPISYFNGFKLPAIVDSSMLQILILDLYNIKS